MSSVGKHIKQLRAVKHMTQEQLAENLFVTRQAVSAWETGKALPDLETLERIAAALGADVTELIYGAPRSPDLKSVKRRWAVIGGIFVFILSVLVVILHANGSLGTWISGLQYQVGHPAYNIFYQDLPGTYSLELDLKDPEANAGRVLYEDDSGCHIVVEELTEDGNGDVRVFFRAHGIYDRTGGQLVSGIVPLQTGTFHWEDRGWPQASVTVGNLTRKSSFAGSTGLNWKDGNYFGFYLTAEHADDRYFSYEDVAAQEGKITLSVSELTRMTTERMWYWDLY